MKNNIFTQNKNEKKKGLKVKYNTFIRTKEIFKYQVKIKRERINDTNIIYNSVTLINNFN